MSTSLTRCKKLIADEENKRYRPTISHYRDAELNGMLKNPKFKETGSGKEHTGDIVQSISVSGSMLAALEQLKADVGDIIEVEWKGKKFLWVKINKKDWSKVIPNSRLQKFDISARELIDAIENHNKRFDTDFSISRRKSGRYDLYNKNKIFGIGFSPAKVLEFLEKDAAKKMRNPSRQNYDETAIYETHIDETLDNHAAMFHGHISGKRIKSVGSDYTNSEVTRLGKLHSFVIEGDNGEQAEIKPSGQAYLSMDIRKNLQFDGRGVQFPHSLRPKRGLMRLVGKLMQIDYIDRKTHIEKGQLVRFYHELGEVTKEVPTLWIDKDGMPVIIGGNYDVWKSGIVN